MEPDARIFCELLNVEDESWQDCVEACLGDRRFDILVPPAHYAAAKSAFVALKDKVGPISLLDTPGLRKANRRADTAPADSLAAQVTSENPLAAQYADTILRRIVCCDTPDTLENYPDTGFFWSLQLYYIYLPVYLSHQIPHYAWSHDTEAWDCPVLQL